MLPKTIQEAASDKLRISWCEQTLWTVTNDRWSCRYLATCVQRHGHEEGGCRKAGHPRVAALCLRPIILSHQIRVLRGNWWTNRATLSAKISALTTVCCNGPKMTTESITKELTPCRDASDWMLRVTRSTISEAIKLIGQMRWIVEIAGTIRHLNQCLTKLSDNGKFNAPPTFLKARRLLLNDSKIKQIWLRDSWVRGQSQCRWCNESGAWQNLQTLSSESTRNMSPCWSAVMNALANKTRSGGCCSKSKRRRCFAVVAASTAWRPANPCRVTKLGRASEDLTKWGMNTTHQWACHLDQWTKCHDVKSNLQVQL